MDKIKIYFKDSSTSQLKIFSEDKKPVFGEGQKSLNNKLVLLLPAMGVSCGYYQPFGEALAKEGFLVASFDYRGTGESSYSVSRNNAYDIDDLIDDIDTIIVKLFEMFPGRDVFLMGHSFGGTLSMIYTAKYPKKISGLLFVSSCSIYYKGWGRGGRWPLLAFTHSLLILAKVIGYLPGKTIGFGGRESRNIISEWARTSRTGMFRLKRSSLDFDSLLSKIKKKVLCIVLSHDHIFSPEKAVKNMMNKLDNSDINLITLDGFPSGSNHFNWARGCEKVEKAILDWLKSQ